jgi:hypothetical protein
MRPNSLTLCAALLSVFAASCSDPADPPGRAGATFSISSVSPAVAGKACNTFGSTYRIPPPPQASPTQTALGQTVTDGKNGAEVSCTVHQEGEGFSVMARVALELNSVYVNYTIPSATGTGTGTGMSQSEWGTQESDPAVPCNFVSLQAKPGAAWASFNCPAIFDRQSPNSSYCSLSGVIAVQDCGK